MRSAVLGVASGQYDIVLALGVEKVKDTGFGGLGTGRGMSSVYEARRSSPGSFCHDRHALFSQTYGIDPEEGKKILGAQSR